MDKREFPGLMAFISVFAAILAMVAGDLLV